MALAGCPAAPPAGTPTPDPAGETSTPEGTTAPPATATPGPSPAPSSTPTPETPTPLEPTPGGDSPTPSGPTPSATPVRWETPTPPPPRPPDVPTPTPEPDPTPGDSTPGPSPSPEADPTPGGPTPEGDPTPGADPTPGDPTPGPFPSPEPEDALSFGSGTARNVVIIHVDTLRADHLPSYGYGRNTTPLLGGYGWSVASGLYAASSWTAPSSASMFTGLDLDEHGVRYYVVTPNGDGVANQVLTAPTFVDHLHTLGYATGVFSGNEFVSPQSGFGAGVDLFINHGKDPGISNLGQLTSPALGWLDSLSPGRPFLMIFQPMDVHEPYSPQAQDLGTWSDPANLPVDLNADGPTQAAQLAAAYQQADQAGKDEITYQMRALYDEQLLGLDRSISAFLQALEARGVLDDTLVVLTADHGETLNEENDGTFNHGRTVREELVHIPFMILAPGLPGGHQACLARNLDTFPTLVSALDLPPMPDTSGIDLTLGCRDYTLSSNYWLDGSLYYVTAEDGREKLTWDCMDNVEQSYDLETDPAAVHDLGAWGLEGKDDQLRAALGAFVAEIKAAIPGMRCPIATTNQLPTRGYPPLRP